ncbi:MAG TPA: acyl-CoA thioesterase [Beijerinckiaceae bacterium]|nr:acyl-CoA thioesterase [Beijerinckiaceae bacterium]
MARTWGVSVFTSQTRLWLSAAAVLALAAPVAQAQTVNIVVIGDSNVAGTGVSAEDRYPSQLEAALKARGLDVRVSNQGVNGEVSAATASRAGWIGSGTDIVVYWNGCQNDRRHGMSLDACRSSNGSAMATLAGKGILTYLIRPPVHDQSMHGNKNFTLGGEGKMMDFRDGRGAVPDGHFNRAGYAVITQRTLEPVRKLVLQAQKKKAGR